jgi:hypothetical protein
MRSKPPDVSGERASATGGDLLPSVDWNGLNNQKIIKGPVSGVIELEATVVLADRLELFDLRGRRRVEITPDILMQVGWLSFTANR